MENSALQATASQVRRDILRMIHAVNSGHPGGSLGCTDYVTALYFEVMKHNPAFNMDGMQEDLFFLSNGHISALLYSVLARSGYFDIKELGTFRKLNTRLQGHPTTHEHLPGIRVASGSLGQGLSVAAGAAYAKKLNNDDRWVFSLHGDGELQEGQIWEAAQFAAHHRLDNLISAVDWNMQQIDGPTEKVMANGDLDAKFTAFGWECFHLDGNNMEDVTATIKLAQQSAANGKPKMLLMKTAMGFGVDFMMNDHQWHGVAPNDTQLAAALAQLPETLGDY
jgi:transketolase